MTWHLHRRDEIIKTHWDKWDQLNKAYFNNHPYLDSLFMKPLLFYFGNRNVYMGEYRHKKHTVAILLVEQQGPGVWKTFSPSQIQIAPVIAPREKPLDFYKQLGAMLRYYNIDEGYGILEQNQFTYIKKHCITTNVDLTKSFKNYWAGRKKNLKKNIRRYLNRVSDNGYKIGLSIFTSVKDTFSALQRYGSIEQKGWKGKEGTAIHSGNIQGEFYGEMLSNFSQNQKALVYELSLNNQVVASRLCIHNNDMLIVLKTTYDESLKSYAPGKLLLYKLLEKEFLEKRFRSIEFYTNASKDQIDWSTGTRQIYHMDVFSNPLLKKIYLFQKKLKGRLDEH